MTRGRPTTQELLTGRGRFTMADVRAAGGRLPVSAASDWNAPVWLLDRGRGAPARVSFEDVPEGFADSARVMTWTAMLPGDGRRRLSPGTLQTLSSQCGRVFGFLDSVLEQMSPGTPRDLGRILPAHFEAFRQATAMLARDDATGSRTTNGAADIFFKLWRLLGQTAAEMRVAGVPALSFVPGGGLDPGELARAYPKRSADPLGALPDAAAALVMAAAAAHIDRGGEDVVRFAEVVFRALDADGDVAGGGFVRAVRTFDWSVAADGKPWTKAPHGRGPKPHLGFARRILSRMVGACVTVVFQELGCRPEEFESFRSGRQADTGLPSCVERVEVGAVSLFLVHGLVFKQRGDEGEPEVWTAGVVGRGGNELPPAVAALDLLERLCAPARAMIDGCTSLAINFDVRVARADRLPTLAPMSPKVLKDRMRQFLGDVDWSPLRDVSECARIVREAGRSAGSRVMRKSLVAYGMRLDPTLLEPLRGQLHHADADVTDADYLTSDPALLERSTDLSSLEVARMMLESSGAAAHPEGLGRALAPHMADVATLKEAFTPAEWLDRAASLVKARGLATGRTHVALASGLEDATRAPALLQRYRACMGAVLDGRRLGIPGEYRALLERAEEAARALAAMGVDVPGDEEVLRG